MPSSANSARHDPTSAASAAPVAPRILGLLAIVASIGFGVLASQVVSNGVLVAADVRVDDWLHADARVWLVSVMRTVSLLNGLLPSLLLSTALAGLLYRQREQRWLRTLALAVPGGMLLNGGLKRVFERPRPHFAEPLVSLSSWSFPSGHVAAATVLYGFAAAFAVTHVHSPGARFGFVVLALLLVALVAFSRLYLGAHYLSDVVAAFFEGTAWLAACMLLLMRSRQPVAAQGGRG